MYIAIMKKNNTFGFALTQAEYSRLKTMGYDIDKTIHTKHNIPVPKKENLLTTNSCPQYKIGMEMIIILSTLLNIPIQPDIDIKKNRNTDMPISSNDVIDINLELKNVNTIDQFLASMGEKK